MVSREGMAWDMEEMPKTPSQTAPLLPHDIFTGRPIWWHRTTRSRETECCNVQSTFHLKPCPLFVPNTGPTVDTRYSGFLSANVCAVSQIDSLYATFYFMLYSPVQEFFLR